jgi:hypothetical protein
MNNTKDSQEILSMSPARQAAFSRQLLSCVVLGVFTVALAGCKPDKIAKGTVNFSHGDHLEMVEGEADEMAQFTDCANCHNAADPAASARAGHDACTDCHDIDMDAPDAECLTCHTGIAEDELPDDTAVAAAAMKRIMKEAGRARTKAQADAWDHQHLTGKVDCAICHGDVMAGAPLPGKNYHRDHGVPEDCTVCHGVDYRDVKPKSHASKQSWLSRHGVMSHAGQQPDCAACHTEESFCTDCHTSTRPKNHNAIFRDRGHGFAAISNRQDCATCHRQDQCQSCHQDAEPRSHTATFKDQGHCRSCHISNNAVGSSCQTCHELDVAAIHQVGRPADGRRLHALPQGFGNDLRNDCRVCHDFTVPPDK